MITQFLQWIALGIKQNTCLIIIFIPKEAKQTWIWLSKIPTDDLLN